MPLLCAHIQIQYKRCTIKNKRSAYRRIFIETNAPLNAWKEILVRSYYYTLFYYILSYSLCADDRVRLIYIYIYYFVGVRRFTRDLLILYNIILLSSRCQAVFFFFLTTEWTAITSRRSVTGGQRTIIIIASLDGNDVRVRSWT